MNTIKRARSSRTSLSRLLLSALSLAAFLSLLPAVSSAQTEVDADETVKVSSQVVRVGITVPPSSDPVRLLVYRGADAKQQPSVDTPGPSSPLSLVVLLDMSSPSGAAWRDVGDRLSKLQRQLGLKQPPNVVIVHPDFPTLPVGQSPRLPFKLPEWDSPAFALDVRSAFDYAVRIVEGFKTPRRALLVITDRFAEMPADILERTDERLVYNPALVYVASVRRQKSIRYGSPDRVISRMNLVGWQHVSVRASGDYVGAQFEHFVSAANGLHVVSFPVAEEELSQGPTYVVEARSGKQDRVLNRQTRKLALVGAARTLLTHAREFPFDVRPQAEEAPAPVAAVKASLSPASSPTPAAQDAPSPSTAAAAWLESVEFKSLVADPSVIFSRIETDPERRAKDVAGLPEWVRDSRLTDGPEVEKARAALAPLFTAFPAASKLELFVYKSDAVFVALAERSLLVVSTGAVSFFDGHEMVAADSHELAHLYFFEAYADAFMRRDYALLQLIELKCDALGMALSVRLGESPDALAQAVRRHEQLLEQLGQYDPVLVPMHPTLTVRLALLGRVGTYLNNNRPPERASR
jgi:hypothetical protein